MLFVAVLGTVIAFFLIKNVKGAMGLIVLTATVVSFISAPILAVMNYLVFKGTTIPDEHKPKGLLKAWCRLGIAVLAISSILYIWVVFIKEKPESPKAQVPVIEKILNDQKN